MAGEFLALVSLHQGHHNKTPNHRFGAVEASSRWTAQALPIDALLDHVLAGKAWAACHFEDGKRSGANAGASNLIVLDIDGDLSLEDFWAISFVQRHCLLTYTSCSHNPDGEHRFRALFRCDEHDQKSLHKAIYAELVEALGFTPKDPSGEQPEKLWFGNTAALVRSGGGAPLDWDLIERANERQKKAEAERPAAWDQSLPPDDKLLAKADYALRHLLPVSQHGGGKLGYDDYWVQVLNAAASAGDVLFEAFQDWSLRGEHGKEQRMTARRWAQAGGRISVRTILWLAGEHLGDGWWKLLPPELQVPSAIKPPTIIGRSRSLSDIAPLEPWSEPSPTTEEAAPDCVPSTAELEKLAASARYIPIAVSPRTAEGETTAANPSEAFTLKQKLNRLYHLRAHGVLLIGDDLQEVPENDRACLDRELLGEILEQPGYCNQPSEVERDLLTLFRAEQGLRDNSYAAVKSTRLIGPNLKRPTWLVPGFLLAGGEHILYSKPGVGKTTLALHMARAVTGDPGLDRFLDSGPLNNHHHWQRNQIIFIGTDMFASAAEMTTQYLEDFKLLGLEFLQQIEWWFETEDSPPWQLNLKDLTKLYQTLESHHHNGTPVPAVFIDSMKAVCPDHLLVGQQGFKDYIKLVKMICKRFSTALIWVHHSRADGSGAQGITRITEGSDVNFHMKRDEKTRQITLDIEKIRGGKGRTLYVDPFKPLPVLLPNPEAIPDDGDLENDRELLILEVLADNFKQHRLINMTSSAEWIEKTYLGMKIGEIEQALRARFRSLPAGLSRASLERLLRDMRAAGKISGKSRFRLPPHFQIELPQQGELTSGEGDPEDLPDLPGW